MNKFHDPDIYTFQASGERSSETLFVSDYVHFEDTGQLTAQDQLRSVKTAYNNPSCRRYLALLNSQGYIRRFRDTLAALRLEFLDDIVTAARRHDIYEVFKAVRQYDTLNPLYPDYHLEDFADDLPFPSLVSRPEEQASLLIQRSLQSNSFNDIIRTVHRYDKQIAILQAQYQPPPPPQASVQLLLHPIFQLWENRLANMAGRFPTLQTSNLVSVREDGNTAGGSPRDAAKLNMLRRMRPPPFKYAWTFFHDRHSDSADYTNRLTVLLENIISLKPFWEAFNRFPLENLKMKDSVHFFKRGVKPVWEDPRNVKGGGWTFRVQKDKSEQFWKEVLLLAVGEQFADVLEPKDDLCGLSLSTRFNSNLITIWNRDGTNQKAIDGICDVVLNGVSPDIKPRDNSYYYKKHSEHQGFDEAVAKAQAEADQAAQAKMEQDGKIEEAKVTAIEVAKQEKEDEEEEAKQAARNA